MEKVAKGICLFLIQQDHTVRFFQLPGIFIKILASCQTLSIQMRKSSLKLIFVSGFREQGFQIKIGSTPELHSLSFPDNQKTDSNRLYPRSEEHTSELQSRGQLVCRLLLETKK